MLTKIKHRMSGATPLYIAAERGLYLDVVRHLVEAGADKDQAQNERCNTIVRCSSERLS